MISTINTFEYRSFLRWANHWSTIPIDDYGAYKLSQKSKINEKVKHNAKTHNQKQQLSKKFRKIY